MSVATQQWADGDFGADSIYTMEQQWQTLRALSKERPDSVPEEFAAAAGAESLSAFATAWKRAMGEEEIQNGRKADNSAAQWPSLALTWLEKVFEEK